MPTAKPAPNRPRETARRKIVIKPNAGPQFDFLASEADIAIYGGAAGGGKTYGMLLDPLKRREVPGYDAMIFRRIGAQITLPGGLWTSSVKLYPYCGGTGFPGKRVWVWENGFSVSFRHLEDEARCRLRSHVAVCVDEDLRVWWPAFPCRGTPRESV